MIRTNDSMVIKGIEQQINDYWTYIDTERAWFNSDAKTLSEMFGTFDIRPKSRLLFCVEMALNKVDEKFDLVEA